MKPLHFIIAGTFLIGTFASCKKEENKSTDLRIRLTDAPYDASEVNVDIEQVRVKFSDDNSDTEGWIDLATTAGIYNLLDYQNGVDTLLAHAVVPTGRLREIRLVLGSDNSIKIGTNVYPLTIPSGSSSGLKIKLDKNLRPDLDSVIVDFDAALSIFQEGTGDYKLKPVLKIK
ncbi:DUF4382 domain-containing protein [Chitinophaga horti]|uniref:DUF4382 domain-containing protein n=1 Tax=Chitinophaga horti TaxID=2920382 RepID=A0ABY6IZM9_9BACT|nr:DUF4382 domain-containing protein [Chitinophaga horti]UYQ91449.1 DUF4382 domain-containing protein [Chitinophaga horti]